MEMDFKTPENFDGIQEGITYGELAEVEYYSNTTGANRKCFVYTPPGYDPDKTYPVLYLLHGIGGIHTEWLGGAPKEVLSNLIAKGEAASMIAVIPNVRAMKDDGMPEDIFSPECIAAFDGFIHDLRDDLMPFIQKNYKVYTEREQCAIAGLSMGGREALFIGIKMPDTFGYIGAFSPAPGLTKMDSGDGRHHPGQLTPEEMTLPDRYKDCTYILLCSGTEEERFGQFSAAYRSALDSNGVKYTYYLTEGGHDFRVWKNGLYHFAKKLFK